MPFGQNARMNPSRPRFMRDFRASAMMARVAMLLLAACAALPIGCKAMPYEGPGEWYVGKATVTGDATIFGAGGDTSIMWQLPAGTTDWIWRVSTGPTTREWAIERRFQHASDDPDQGEVWWMGDSTGSWSGAMKNSLTANLPQMSIGTHNSGTPPFRAFTIDGVPANGDGRIEGKGEKVSDEIFVTLQWIKGDGSVGAQWKYNGLGQNEEEYLRSLTRMGAEPPATIMGGQR
jgi:hypothetical protein